MAKGLTPEQTRVLQALRAAPEETHTAWALRANVRTLFSLERKGLVIGKGTVWTGQRAADVLTWQAKPRGAQHGN